MFFTYVHKILEQPPQEYLCMYFDKPVNTFFQETCARIIYIIALVTRGISI